MTSESRSEADELPVWFYIGALLTAYGLLLLAAGIYQFSHPPQTVLAGYHATFWAGIVLLLIGSIYVALFHPWRHRKDKQR